MLSCLKSDRKRGSEIKCLACERLGRAKFSPGKRADACQAFIFEFICSLNSETKIWAKLKVRFTKFEHTRLMRIIQKATAKASLSLKVTCCFGYCRQLKFIGEAAHRSLAQTDLAHLLLQNRTFLYLIIFSHLFLGSANQIMIRIWSEYNKIFWRSNRDK